MSKHVNEILLINMIDLDLNDYFLYLLNNGETFYNLDVVIIKYLLETTILDDDFLIDHENYSNTYDIDALLV